MTTYKVQWNPIWTALWRFARVAIAIIVAGIVAKYSHESWFIAIAPLLSGMAKYLRDKWNVDLYLI